MLRSGSIWLVIYFFIIRFVLQTKTLSALNAAFTIFWLFRVALPLTFISSAIVLGSTMFSAMRTQQSLLTYLEEHFLRIMAVVVLLE